MGYTVRGIFQARTGAGSLFLLQGIFPSQGSNTGLPHCRRILYQLSHKGSPDLPLFNNPPADAGDTGWILGPERFPHMSQRD